VDFELRFFLRDLNHGLEMAWSDPSHSSFRFPYDKNGSIGRGDLGHHLSWRAHGGLGPHYLLVLVVAWRRAHLWRRAHH
jgi:hypothetical protein